MIMNGFNGFINDLIYPLFFVIHMPIIRVNEYRQNMIITHDIYECISFMYINECKKTTPYEVGFYK